MIGCAVLQQQIQWPFTPPCRRLSTSSAVSDRALANEAFAEGRSFGPTERRGQVIVVSKDDDAALDDRTPHGRADAVGHVDEGDASQAARGVILRGDRARVYAVGAVVLTGPKLERRAARSTRQA